MKQLSKNSLKTFLYAYLAAVIIVAVYFASTFIFKEEKTIEHKSFNAVKKNVVREETEGQEEDNTAKFILLPK